MSVFENVEIYLQFRRDYKTSFPMIPNFYKMKSFGYISYYVLYILQAICSISQNNSGRHKVPFVVMCHICSSMLMTSYREGI